MSLQRQRRRSRCPRPPTARRCKTAIDNLQLGERTAIGEAIFASLDAIKTGPDRADGTEVPARIVLMSDGTTTDGRTNDAGGGRGQGGQACRSRPSPSAPTTAPSRSRRSRCRSRCRSTRPRSSRSPSDTGGQFYAAASEGQLKQVYENIGSSVGYDTEQREISTWFIGGALLLLLVTGGFSLLWFQRLP